jgi:uncharacterized iron-regulated protein
VIRRLLLLLALEACATPPAKAPAKVGTSSDLGRSHPLWNRIWDARASRFIDQKTLASRVARHRYVLLGERHDNPNHHWLQARILRSLVRAGRRPAVAWEMITDDQRQRLEAFLAKDGTAEGLGKALGWEHHGWPAWRHYLPVAEIALEARLLLAPAGIDRSTLRRMLRGPDSQPTSLPAAVAADLRRSIREAHCGHASGRMLEMMVLAQKLRDRHMARRLQEAARGSDGGVLIAGNGHVRRDRGVPFYLEGARTSRSQGGVFFGGDVASVGILEVMRGKHDPAAYSRGAFDYVWFTSRVDNVDPCEKFREQLERMRSRHRHHR